jgi:hypothetical protein
MTIMPSQLDREMAALCVGGTALGRLVMPIRFVAAGVSRSFRVSHDAAAAGSNN